MVDASSPLSSSLSMCGNDRPRQKSGKFDSGGSVIRTVETSGAAESPPQGVVVVSVLLAILFRAYLLVSLFLLIISRRFRPHLGEPSGLSNSSLPCCWDAAVVDDDDDDVFEDADDSVRSALRCC